MASARYTVMGDFYAIVTQVVEGVRSGRISLRYNIPAMYTQLLHGRLHGRGGRI